jgi:V/A-type H+-transporting ATPase subunit E
MDAQKVIEKILSDAGTEAQKIGQEAREKQAGEQAGVEQQLGDYRAQTKALAEKAGKDEKLHILAAARMQIAKEYLAEKRKILDEVFEQAHRRVQSLPDGEYRQLMAHLMLTAVETGEQEVVIGNKEGRIDASLLQEVNDRLAASGKGNLKLSQQRQNFAGGFILKRGKIKTNVSIDVLLDRARKELEIELAGRLFEG